MERVAEIEGSSEMYQELDGHSSQSSVDIFGIC